MKEWHGGSHRQRDGRHGAPSSRLHGEQRSSHVVMILAVLHRFCRQLSA